MEDAREPTTWWGSFTLAEEQTGCWHIGPSRVQLCRLRHEWRLVHTQTDDPMDDASRVVVPVPQEEALPPLADIDPDATLNRFSFRQTDAAFAIRPALADRAVVVRPETPFYVMDAEEVTLYVSTPLWMCIEMGDPARLLHEFPLYRPSDTWFGISTTDGEMCYASRTLGRLLRAELPPRPHRAITPMRIRNHAREALLFERVRIPVQYLSLYQTPNDFLWTGAVTLRREKDDDLAALHVEAGAPPDVPNARLLREPRETVKTSLLVRPFSLLYHKIKEV